MQIDLTSFMFGIELDGGAGTPAWGTALGQNQEKKLNPQSENFYAGLIYSAIEDIGNVKCPLGKGGAVVVGGIPNDKFSIDLASKFNKVFVNGQRIEDSTFILLVTKEKASVHAGRRTLKYNIKITYNDNNINEDCVEKIKSKFGLNDKSAWLVYDIDIVNQDELHFKLLIVDKKKSKVYANSEERKKDIERLFEENNIEIIDDNNERLDLNKIIYGVPGVGKSHKINEVRDKFNQERTVFHPEYTNSDFVGQLIPKRDENNDGHISYVFENGPFTRVLINALKDKDNKYMLAVEEINRGNAAAIFGEIFQLLDRENGISKYAIENKTIVEAIRKEYPDYDKDYKEILESYKPTFNKDNDYLVFIPANLYIWATMNTSDQNVYTLDTAFQRRWAMEMISIDFDKDDASKTQGNLIIDGSNRLTWRAFVEKINSIMETKKVDMVSTEDKRLGTFFATDKEIGNRKLFIQKVIKYLWDDAFKLEKSEGEIFNIKKYPSLDKIVESDAKIENFFMPSLFGVNSETENENVDNEQES